MPIELNLSKTDIERFVKDAIMESAIGTLVQSAINDALKTSSYDNPISKAVKVFVAEVATRLVREKFAGGIEEAVKKTIEDKVTEEVVVKMTKEASDKIVRAVEERSY